MWEKFKSFLKRKDIEVSVKRYGIDALGAMAQGLFCSLLIGTILNTLGLLSGPDFNFGRTGYKRTCGREFFTKLRMAF